MPTKPKVTVTFEGSEVGGQVWRIDVGVTNSDTATFELTLLDGGAPMFGFGTDASREELQALRDRLSAVLEEMGRAVG